MPDPLEYFPMTLESELGREMCGRKLCPCHMEKTACSSREWGTVSPTHPARGDSGNSHPMVCHPSGSHHPWPPCNLTIQASESVFVQAILSWVSVPAKRFLTNTVHLKLQLSSATNTLYVNIVLGSVVGGRIDKWDRVHIFKSPSVWMGRQLFPKIPLQSAKWALQIVYMGHEKRKTTVDWIG